MNSNLNRAFANRRGRTPRSNFELYSWFFMRVSGVVLLGIVLFHFFYMHFVIGVDNIDYHLIAERWMNPLWRIFDLALLVFAMTHGINGLRYILDDYLHSPGWLVFAKSVGFIVYALVIGLGTYIIFTFAPETVLTSMP